MDNKGEREKNFDTKINETDWHQIVIVVGLVRLSYEVAS